MKVEELEKELEEAKLEINWLTEILEEMYSLGYEDGLNNMPCGWSKKY